MWRKSSKAQATSEATAPFSSSPVTSSEVIGSMAEEQALVTFCISNRFRLKASNFCLNVCFVFAGIISGAALEAKGLK